MNNKTRKITTLAMLCAIAYGMVFFTHNMFPIVNIPGLTLCYDPKDIIIAFAGFIFGPLASLTVSVVVSLLEAVTISTTGPIGFLMNVISSCSFACVAALIYKKKRDLVGAVIGLVSGALFATAAMILWNYFITPFYVPVPREAIKGMLIPYFLPFNFIKGGLNTAFTLLLYKPLVSALRKAKLIAPAKSSEGKKGLPNIAIAVVSVLVIIALIAIVFVYKKQI